MRKNWFPDLQLCKVKSLVVIERSHLIKKCTVILRFNQNFCKSLISNFAAISKLVICFINIDRTDSRAKRAIILFFLRFKK